jgi:uncharacterized protein YebE (UPF0316 family)
MDDTMLIPLKIFFAEMCVVTLGTLRIIFVSRGRRFLAPCLGFFEIVIWLFAITQVMSNLDSPVCFLAFAGGFTIGNFLGILLEQMLAMGMVMVRIITPQGGGALADRLRARQFGVTCVDGQGARGPVHVMLSVAPRRQLKELLGIIEQNQPDAFYAVDELQSASNRSYLERPRASGLLPTVLLAFKRLRASAFQKQSTL